MKRVVIASKNPVKIQAAKIAFEKMFPNEQFELVGISVPSGVPDQPMSDEETLRGAINRAKNAQVEMEDAHYWVGMEGGLEEKEGRMEAFAWMVVLSKDKMSKSRTATFDLPDKVAELVRQGMELAHADDQVFGRENSKHTNGAVGLLTDDVIDRTIYYSHAAILALIPFKNEELY